MPTNLHFTKKHIFHFACVCLQVVLFAMPVYAQKIKMQGTPHKFEKRQGNGLTAEYEAKGENTVKSYNAIDAKIDFSWDTLTSQYAAPNIDVLDFTAKWLGGLYAPKAGKYTFVVEADDGIRLFLNDYPVIDEWHEHGKKSFEKEVHLKAEQLYDLRLEYIQLSGGQATIRLKWRFEKDTLSIIEQKYLFSDYNRRPLQPMVTIEKDETPIAIEDEFVNLLQKKRITLQHISFERGSAKLQPSSFEELDKLAQTLRANEKINIELAGHTDNVGNESANQRLSKLRAVAVGNYLITKGGIAEKRIVANGYGSKEPIADNFTEEGRIKNRRVELRVID
jgi:outer membrane protein OmpA-like peptidoglycan-associated protein